MQKYITFYNGNRVPVIGLGTWEAGKNVVGDAVKFAITKAGYRHIDCASIYGNEKEIGEGLKDVLSPSVKREELFITSKLWNTDHRGQYVEKACRKTLADLRLEYLDLYLMHWGIAFAQGNDLEPIDKDGYAITEAISVQQTWQAMESLVKTGVVKSIGVANFTTVQLIDLLTYAKIKPVMNQVELHPYLPQTELVNFCHYKNISVTAYSPLGTPGNKSPNDPALLDDKVILKIAKAHHRSPAQILLNWAIRRGTIVIPKSTHEERIKENVDIFDFELTDEEQTQMSALNKNYRFVNPSQWWDIPYFA